MIPLTNTSGRHSRRAVLAVLVCAGLGLAIPAWCQEQLAAARQLHGLFDNYLQQRFALDPYYATTKRDMRFNHLFANTWDPDWIEQRVALEQQFLEAAMTIPEENLSPRLRIDRQAFLHTRNKYLDYYRFPHHLLPISPVDSRLNNFARMGSGGYYFRFDTVQDYDDWLARVEAAQPWFDQLILNFQQGIEQGVVHPRVIAERVLAQLRPHIVADPHDSLYYRPISNLPDGFSAADRARLDAAYQQMIMTDLVPAYRRIASFLETQYLPAARASTGFSDLPGGDDWYRQCIRYYTSVDLTAEEIHRIGLQQVARLSAEMDALRKQLGGKGPLGAWLVELRDDPAHYFDSEAELLAAYEALLEPSSAAAVELFSLIPRARMNVRPVEAFRAASSASGSYRRPPADLSGPGTFYVNTYDLKMHPKFRVETLFMHEAIPGHHFQIALMMEAEHLPPLRRLESETAFTEGWALYVQSLGPDMGLYQDPMQQFGYLNSMMFRALRLVVDTGLHAMGWSREEANRYMLGLNARSTIVIRNEIDRYIARPGQALAYMLGNLQIQGLRDEAEVALGDRFDVRAFHAVVLEDGALPLAVLHTKVRNWISTQSP